MALDARVRYTKMVIRNSFITLLKEKPFHAIKLKEVCALAGINRSTFYRYYSDIFDWKEQIEAECLSQAKKLIDQLDTADPRTILVHILTAIQADLELYQALFSHRGDLHVLEQVLAMGLEKTERTASGIYDRWSSYYGSYGCMGVIQCWIEDGLTQPPEEVADYMADILRRTVG